MRNAHRTSAHGHPWLLTLAGVIAALAFGTATAAPFTYSNLQVDGQMATASRPDSTAGQEIESADDFVTTQTTSITAASFIGLLPPTAPLSSIAQVRIEIYRVFPFDSDTVRTINVPTRANSPSDVAFAERDSSASGLSFSTSLLNSTFTAANSVRNGINKAPNQTTGGEGAVTGQEVQFDVSFSTPFVLPADHYFFIPQVLLTSGDFYWLSALRPIVTPGTPFTPDLQSWIRNETLDPDWLRVGTDIVGQGTFNAAFALTGTTTDVPEPELLALILAGVVGWSTVRRSGRVL